MVRLFNRKRNVSDQVVMEETELAAYNSERARGIVHNEYWMLYMKRLQREFDQRMVAEHGEGS